MLPAVIGLSATQINITVDNQLASRFGNGPVSWLNYAFRLMQLPIGVFGVAIATATTATVSLHAAQNSLDKLRTTVSSSLRLAACLTFPATVGLIVFREEIVRLLYQRGSFLSYDTLQTSRVLLYYALALFAYSAVKILVPTFYALDDTRTPVRTSMTTVAVKIAVNFALVWHMQFLGLALATAIASWLNFVLLLKALARRMGQSFRWRALDPYLRIGLASVLMGGVSAAAFHASAFVAGNRTQLSLATNLGVAIAAGMAVLLPLLHLFGIGEASEVAGIIRRRLPRRLR
jgi:putative peptidoglycan lipid II flippase